MVTDEYRFDPVAKDPAESIEVTLDLFNLAAIFWEPNEAYALDEYVWPREPAGFVAKCTAAGRSASREPRWPTSGTKSDGSVTWTMEAAGSAGINTVSAPGAVSDPAGLTIGSVAVLEQHKITATYSGGVDGLDYYAVFTFTLKGLPRVARQIVQVRKR